MNNPIEIYRTEDGELELSVTLEQETVWLTQNQMCELFGRERSVITKHINNVFREGELERDAVCAKFARTASDGKRYQTRHYNLDVIISVGYRVRSQRGVQFRQWATHTLKQHLVKGYTLNQRRLQEQGVKFEQALALLSTTLKNQQLVSDEGGAVLSVIGDYARSWSLLQGYDEQNLKALPDRQHNMQTLVLDDALAAITELKQALLTKGEATELFGQLRGDGLASALASIEQGFGNELFYPNVASRAAHQPAFAGQTGGYADQRQYAGGAGAAGC